MLCDAQRDILSSFITDGEAQKVEGIICRIPQHARLFRHTDKDRFESVIEIPSDCFHLRFDYRLLVFTKKRGGNLNFVKLIVPALCTKKQDRADDAIIWEYHPTWSAIDSLLSREGKAATNRWPSSSRWLRSSSTQPACHRIKKQHCAVGAPICCA